jgi:predicted nucleic acid-binding OB-fold protein
MADLPLSPEQEAEAQRLVELFQQPLLQEARRLARLFASKPTTQLLGKTEFELRDAVHQLGTKLLQTALEERKKGATKGPA